MPAKAVSSPSQPRSDGKAPVHCRGLPHASAGFIHGQGHGALCTVAIDAGVSTRPWLTLGLPVAQPVLPGSPGLGRRALATATGADAGEVGVDGGSSDGLKVPLSLWLQGIPMINEPYVAKLTRPVVCRLSWSDVLVHTPNPIQPNSSCKGGQAARVLADRSLS